MRKFFAWWWLATALFQFIRISTFLYERYPDVFKVMFLLSYLIGYVTLTVISIKVVLSKDSKE